MINAATSLAIVVLLVFLPTGADGEPLSESTCAFPMRIDGRPIVVPVQCRGKSYAFIVDTGSTNCVFDVKHRSILGSRVGSQQAEVDGRMIEFEEFVAPPATVGTSLFRLPDRVTCIDLSRISASLSQDVDGILGMDFLRDLVLELEFDRAEVRLGTTPPAGEKGNRIGLTWETGLPSISAGFGEALSFQFIIDTGWYASGATINYTFADKVRHDNAWRVTGRCTLFSAMGESQSVFVRTNNKLQVGPFEHQELVLSLHKTHCLIGLPYLRRYNVTFDFPRAAVYLKPSRYFDDYDCSDQFGIVLEQTDKDAPVRIYGFMENSIADRIGLQPKDIILALDGQRMKGKGITDVYFAIASHRTAELEFTVERDGKLLKMTTPAMQDTIGSVRDGE